jgi:hypothetical protein
MRTQSATAGQPDQREQPRDKTQPAVKELGRAIDEVRRDAVNAPDEYLRDTVVASGGE